MSVCIDAYALPDLAMNTTGNRKGTGSKLPPDIVRDQKRPSKTA
jgi:hypothetical protein